ncbi:MAG TPA: acyltransferase [Candidatus Xenobia bacterium]
MPDRYHPALDGLRALAILAVMWHHAVSGLPAWWQGGDQGVDLFFVLSGYLITALLRRDGDLKRFYARRVLRIFPLYYAVLTVYVVLMRGAGGPRADAFFAVLPAYLTFTANWVVHRPWPPFYLAWSLATEEQFYLVWPFILRVLGRYAWVALAVGLFVANPAICIGAALALVPLPRFRPGTGSVALCLLGVSLALPVPEVARYVVMGLVVVTSVAAPARWLASAPMRWVGKLSYATYLTHMLVLHILRDVLHIPGGPLLFLSLVPGALAFAWGAHVFIERPFLRLKARV